MLSELTQVEAAALPLGPFQEHLRLASGFAPAADQAPMLEAYLRAAMAVIEKRIGKALYERSCALRLTHWLGPEQPLPLAPVAEITEILTYDSMGGETLWPQSRYRLLPDLHRPKIAGDLPAIPTGGYALVHFEAGFGANWTNIPADLRQAVFLLAADYYEHRHSGPEPALPQTIAKVLEPWRSLRLLGGALR